MGAKKAKGTSEGKIEKSAEKSGKQPKKPDIVQVRENITNMVTNSAEVIANKVIEDAKSGQMASVKYLFEVAGLYPPTEETAAALPEHSLAHTLLKRMGLPTEPVIRDEDQEPAEFTGNVKEARKPASAGLEELENEDVPDASGAESDGEEQKNCKDAVE